MWVVAHILQLGVGPEMPEWLKRSQVMKRRGRVPVQECTSPPGEAHGRLSGESMV